MDSLIAAKKSNSVLAAARISKPLQVSASDDLSKALILKKKSSTRSSVSTLPKKNVEAGKTEFYRTDKSMPMKHKLLLVRFDRMEE